jgi:hypothetical protein
MGTLQLFETFVMNTLLGVFGSPELAGLFLLLFFLGILALAKADITLGVVGFFAVVIVLAGSRVATGLGGFLPESVLVVGGILAAIIIAWAVWRSVNR